MRKHWDYLLYVLRHKYYVFIACRRLGVPLWQSLVHDWTKFTPTEWGPYVRRDFSKPPELEWERAWEHHWRNNKHHPHVWSNGRPAPLPMPEVYAREMVADWWGAGMARGMPNVWAWYEKQKSATALHPETRLLVEQLLQELKAKTP
jgi:hypothetical protein